MNKFLDYLAITVVGTTVFAFIFLTLVFPVYMGSGWIGVGVEFWLVLLIWSGWRIAQKDTIGYPGE